MQPKQRQRCFLWLRREDGSTPHPTDVLHGAAWAEVTPLTYWRKPKQSSGMELCPEQFPVALGTSFQLNPLSILLRAQCDTGPGRGEPCPWFGHVSKSLFHVGEPQPLCPLNRKGDGRGWRTGKSSQLGGTGTGVGFAQETSTWKKEAMKRSTGAQTGPITQLNLLLTFVGPPHPSSATSSSPCPAGTGHLQPLLFVTCLQVQLFPATSSCDPCPVPAFLPPARRFPRAFLLCLSTLQSGTLQQCSLIICLPNPSMRGSPR